MNTGSAINTEYLDACADFEAAAREEHAKGQNQWCNFVGWHPGGCRYHDAWKRSMDAQAANLAEAEALRHKPRHAHSWGPVVAGPPDGDPGRWCETCATIQRRLKEQTR